VRGPARHPGLVAVAVAVLVAVLAAGGCGLPNDDRPRVIGEQDAPLLLAPTTQPAEPGEGDDATVDVFFILRETGQLTTLRRRVPIVTPQTAVDQLLLGLGPDDPSTLSSAIPAGTVQVGSTLDSGTLILDLGPAGEGGLSSVQGQAQLQAFAQLVFTATEVAGVRDVLFRVAGEPIDAATEAGAVGQPVTRADYRGLAPASD
jgi:spore germination protein GerM